MLQMRDNIMHSGEKVEEQYMAISIGRITLLTPHSTIASIDSVQHINYCRPKPRSVGWVLLKNNKVPVYSFTDELDFEHSISAGKAVCAVISENEKVVALMCEQASPYMEKIVMVQALPDVMQATASPIESLCLYKNNERDGIDFITSTESLTRYIEHCTA